MSFRSFEHLPIDSLHNSYVQIGARAVGAVFHWCRHELELTRAERMELNGEPAVIPVGEDNGETVQVIRVGFRQSIDRVAEGIDDELAHLGRRYYMKSSPDAAKNKRERIRIARETLGRRMLVYGISKGGKDEVGEYADDRYMKEHGPIDAVFFDSSPFHWRHIRAKGRAAALAALCIPPVHTSASLYYGFAQREITNLLQGDCADLPARIVRSVSPTCFYEHRSELPSLLRPLPAQAQVSYGMRDENIGELFYVSSPHDSTVNTEAAHAYIEQLSGRQVHLKVDHTREWGNHAGITDNTASFVREVETFLGRSRSNERVATSA